jgi:hypothetical protein
LRIKVIEIGSSFGSSCPKDGFVHQGIFPLF